eukprot:PITA_33449
MSHPAGLLQPLPIPEGKRECISMDFITGLPVVQGKDCIFVVVDRLTKYAHFFAISAHYTTAQVVELFFREVFRLHGLSKTIVSDRDSRFMRGFWQELFRVIRRIGQVAYELELPQGSEIHNIFHVSCLKKALGQQVTVTDELPPMDDEGHLVLQPKAIIDTRERQLRSRMVWELVRWNNLPDEDATWESEQILQHPSLQFLEDKQHFAEGDCNIPN